MMQTKTLYNRALYIIEPKTQKENRSTGEKEIKGCMKAYPRNEVV